MTSHGQCPRGGGACECPRGGCFSIFRRADVQTPPPGWLATGLSRLGFILHEGLSTFLDIMAAQD